MKKKTMSLICTFLYVALHFSLKGTYVCVYSQQPVRQSDPWLQPLKHTNSLLSPLSRGEEKVSRDSVTVKSL